MALLDKNSQNSRYLATVNMKPPKQASVLIHIATALTLVGYCIFHSLVGEPLIAGLAGMSALAALCSTVETIRERPAGTWLMTFAIFTGLAILATSWYFGYRGLIMLFPYVAALVFIFAVRIAIWWGILVTLGCLLLALNTMPANQIAHFAIALLLSNILTGVYARKMLEQQRTLWQEANRDWLTGLMSRRRFTERMQQFLNEYRNDPGLFGMIYIDINDFKLINDQNDHATGDAVLVEVALRLRNACIELGYNNPDYMEEPPVARLSGDEFALVTCHLDTEEEIYNTAKALYDSLTGTYHWKNQAIDLGVSIGVFCGRYDRETTETALAKADAAMYFAKRDTTGQGLRMFDAEVESSYNQLFRSPLHRTT